MADVLKNKGVLGMKCSIENLKDAMEQSKKNPFLIFLDYKDFMDNQMTIKKVLGEEGFIMFTEKRAILCMKDAPDLRIAIMKDAAYIKNDFSKLCFQNVELIGSDTKKGWIQYCEDLKCSCKWIIIITVIFFSIYHFDAIRTEDIVSLCESLLNVMGIFISMFFVFIGFVYSDGEKITKNYMNGTGERYYAVNRYIMDLSILIILILIFNISFGKINNCDIPNWISYFENKWSLIDNLISYKMQYFVCQLLTWISVCSMVICFKTLMDYYLKDLEYTFFITALNKKSEKWKK